MALQVRVIVGLEGREDREVEHVLRVASDRVGALLAALRRGELELLVLEVGGEPAGFMTIEEGEDDENDFEGAEEV